jgi:hypothetical protein
MIMCSVQSSSTVDLEYILVSCSSTDYSIGQGGKGKKAHGCKDEKVVAGKDETAGGGSKNITISGGSPGENTTQPATTKHHGKGKGKGNGC